MFGSFHHAYTKLLHLSCFKELTQTDGVSSVSGELWTQRKHAPAYNQWEDGGNCNPFGDQLTSQVCALNGMPDISCLGVQVMHNLGEHESMSIKTHQQDRSQAFNIHR